MSDDTIKLMVWVLFCTGVMAHCMSLEMCKFDAYSYCMRRAKNPAECAFLLPEQWRR